MSKMKEKTEDQKKCRCCGCKCLRHIICGIILFLLGICVGMHWKVIRALINGEPIPEVPAGHCHSFCIKK